MTGSYDQAVSTDTATDIADVAVLGCGNMGSAMARTLLTSGRRVAVWNRTPERARALGPHGAEVQDSAEQALAAAPLAVVCLSTTDDARLLLESETPDGLTGTTILNTTSGTPEDARSLRDWAKTRDVPYLDAAIGAYPEQLGTASARLLVAGDEALWQAHQAAILCLAGSSTYVGDDHGAANAVDCAMTGAFYFSALTAFIEAARFADRFGVPHDVLTELTDYSLSVMSGELKQILTRIRDREFATDQATLDVYSDAAAAFTEALNEFGDAPMMQTTAKVLRRGVDAGLGDQDIAALFTLDA